MLTAAIITHSEIEGAGLLEEIFQERCIPYETIDATSEEIPKAEIYIAMGGPMSANDNKEWIVRELEKTREHVKAGGHYFGVCLGAQMLAKALGGTVKQGRREAGNYAVELTEKGLAEPLLEGLGKRLHTFQWHGETFTLPERARLLARANGMNQMFAYRNALGIQFHLEARKEMIEDWIKSEPFYAAGAGKTKELVLDEFIQNCGFYGAEAREIFGRFLDRAGR